MSQIADGTVKFAVRDSRLNSLLEILYPVGSIKITVSSTAPFSDLGFGTWKEVSKGRVLWGADDSHAVGSTIEAGLPNITGRVHIRPSNGGNGTVWDETNGVVQTKVVSNPNDRSRSINITNPSEMVPFCEINFDASRCSSVYGKSNTVTPPPHTWCISGNGLRKERKNHRQYHIGKVV